MDAICRIAVMGGNQDTCTMYRVCIYHTVNDLISLCAKMDICRTGCVFFLDIKTMPEE